MNNEPIKRIVKLTFQEDKTQEFVQIYEDRKQFISQFEGCRSVELLRCKNPDNIFFTYSHWESEQALENYRQSDLFKETWSLVKPLFGGRAEAWTVAGNTQ